ncbi:MULTISPECIES: hypothetical protein [Streptomyces]|uniref:hypothetical protein n=1 Tax=Streptomyces TaxID=1883 RepID=UPI00025CDA24|nr:MULTISPECIES: hypothetical protein [Streptomyces]AZK95649.1 hypothetical protein B7R87_18635 [Streptomyces tsukubensis]EIF91557.1 hypothetical protein [Streptomyces tsukubensis NRRL18488]
MQKRARSGRWRTVLTAALTMALLPLWATSAGAAGTGADSTSAVTKTRVTLATDSVIHDDTFAHVLQQTLTLAAGEKRHLRARAESTNSITGNVGKTVRIFCNDASGNLASVEAASARNHEGYDTTSYAVPGRLPLYTDLLFTAPAAGTYTCILKVNAYTSLLGNPHLTVKAGSTWLESDDSDRAGAHWWQNPDCASNATTGTCTYVGAAPAQPDAWVFYNDGTVRHKWEAHPDAVTVSAQANLGLTTCYDETGSCPQNMWGPPKGPGAVVDTRFELVQLDTTGHACRTHQHQISRTVGDNAHHTTGYYALNNITIEPSCGTRTFLMRIYVKHVSGQRVKIDGAQRNGLTPLTSGIAFNNF